MKDETLTDSEKNSVNMLESMSKSKATKDGCDKSSVWFVTFSALVDSIAMLGFSFISSTAPTCKLI